MAPLRQGDQICTHPYVTADQSVSFAPIQPVDVFFTSAPYTCDGNGNRIGEQFYQQGGPPTALTTYTWDAAYHLLKIQQSAAGAVDLTNSYRPDGLRHRRTDSS